MTAQETPARCGWLTATTVTLTLAALAAIASAQLQPEGQSGTSTWPPISVNMWADNNYYYIEGRTTGVNGRTVWSDRVAPAGATVTILHGYSTSFVTVNDRQFVVDNLTGRHQEIGNIATRTFPPISPPQTPTPPPYYPPTLPPAVEPTPPSTPTPAPAATAEPLPMPKDPLGQRVAQSNQTLSALMIANDNLVRALVAQDMLPPDSTPAEINRAKLAVQQARIQRQAAQQAAYRDMGLSNTPTALPTATPPPVSLTTPPKVARTTVTEQHREVSLAEDRVTVANAAAAKARIDLDDLTQQNASSDAIAAAQQKARDAAAALSEARMKLEKARMAAEFPPPSFLNPDLRDRVNAAQKRVLDLTQQLHDAQRAVRAAREAVDNKTGTNDQLAQAGAGLLAAMEKLDNARGELDDLRASATFFRAGITGRDYNVQQPTTGASPSAD